MLTALVVIAIVLVACFVIYAVRREPVKREKAATLEGAGGGSHSTARPKEK